MFCLLILVIYCLLVATPMVGVAGALGWVAAPTPAPTPAPSPQFTPAPIQAGDAQHAAIAGQMAG